jgi:hypothetical protein
MSHECDRRQSNGACVSLYRHICLFIPHGNTVEHTHTHNIHLTYPFGIDEGIYEMVSIGSRRRVQDNITIYIVFRSTQPRTHN